MRADTKTISIDAAPRKVVQFLADPRNLPRWAVGFAMAVRREGERWLVQTASGEMSIRIVNDDTTGVVDFRMSPAPGIEAMAASRVIPRGNGAEYAFTQFQAAGTSDEAFQKSVKAVEHELNVLKAIIEIECPL